MKHQTQAENGSKTIWARNKTGGCGPVLGRPRGEREEGQLRQGKRLFPFFRQAATRRESRSGARPGWAGP